MASVFKLESSRTVPRARALANPQDIYQVSKGQFAEIGPLYSQFTNLEKLTLDDNNYGHASQTDINALPQTITALTVISRGMDNMDLLYNRLPNIERLEVRYAKNPVSDAISNLKNLKYLTIWWDFTYIPTFSDCLSACTKLESLEIHTKKPIDLSGVLTYMPNLRNLNISALFPANKKQIPAIVFPDNMIEFPPNLESLVIYTKGHVVSLPSQPSILPNLTRLNINECTLRNAHMLNNIDCMPNLEDLCLNDIKKYNMETITINTNLLYNIRDLYIYISTCGGTNDVRFHNPDFANNPNLECLRLEGACTEDFANFPENISACKRLYMISFRKTNCKIIIPDEITQLSHLGSIAIPYAIDIKYMPHPDSWPHIDNSVYNRKCIIKEDWRHGVTIHNVYYSQISPDCKCRNPYYYLDKCDRTCTHEYSTTQCTCAQPGLIDKHTGQILTFPMDMTANTPNISTYRAQIEDYIQRHQFTYPEPHPLLPQHAAVPHNEPPPDVNVTTAVP
jgi:hypothetical protein